MVFLPTLVLVSSIAFSLSPGAEAAVIPLPLPLQARTQRPIMREERFVSARRDASKRGGPPLKVSPKYDEDHSQHWNYHHGYVNKDGHGHGPPHRRSEASKRNLVRRDIIDMDLALEKRHSHSDKHETSRPVGGHDEHHPLVKVEVEKRHHHHGDHWDGDHGHFHEHDHKKRGEVEARHDHDHDHEHGHGHYHGHDHGHYDHNGHWHHDKRDEAASDQTVEERSTSETAQDKPLEERSHWEHDHYHGHGHGHHHHHGRSETEHGRDERAKKGGKKGHSFGTKKGGKSGKGGKGDKKGDKKKGSSAKSEKSDKHSESKRAPAPPLATAGTPGFVESTFFNSTLSRSIAGLIYSANPDPSPNATAFTLGTSTIQSTQFYLTAVPTSDSDSSTSEYNIVNIRVPILNSQQLLTTDYCATFDLTPPSPLSLVPCGDSAGFSQNFAYNSTTSELQPLYAATPAPMAMVDTSKGMQTKATNSFASSSDSTDDSDAPAQSIALFFVPASAYYQPAVPMQNLFEPSTTSSSGTSASTMTTSDPSMASSDPMASAMASSPGATATSAPSPSSTGATPNSPSSSTDPNATSDPNASDAPVPSTFNTGAPPTPSGTTVDDGSADDGTDSGMADPMAGATPTGAMASATPARRLMKW
ncbi:hypothetical protein RQP46_008012 [Phenoliferia psychrophenolica]